MRAFAVTNALIVDLARKQLSKGKRGAQSSEKTEKEIPTPRPSGNAAPARALGVITTGLTNSVEDSLAMELDAIVDLGETEATQNLIRNFFLADKYKKGRGDFEKILKLSKYRGGCGPGAGSGAGCGE